MIKRLFLCLSVLCLAALTSNGSYGSAEPPVTPTAPALSESLRTGLDAALEEGRSFSGAPAATATVIRCGGVLWSGASGVKNIRPRPPTTPDTLFAVASSTKPITAALVLHLVEGGDLSLNTKLSRFYPDLPRAGTITVRMLLNHTSGLNEYFDDPQIIRAIIHDPDHDWNRAEVLRGITSTKFKPGKRYSYSNSAYVILGGMIKKLTGDTVEQVFRRVIADPLGLSDSTFVYRPQRSHLFAHPYLQMNGELEDAFAPGVGVPSDFWGPVWTDGGLASTSPDLARFGDALFRGEILEPKTVKQMTRVNRFGSHLGIDEKSYAGRTWLGHNGRYVGYESELWHDESRGVTVAVNTNTEKSSLATWKKIVAAYDDAMPNARPCGSA